MHNIITLPLSSKLPTNCYRTQIYGVIMCITILSPSSYLDSIERAVANGDCLLLENIGEDVDPVLDPLLGRLTIKKGKYIKIGDKEVEYHPKFRLILQVGV